jgi:redox-sensitive bicupin YhaK (pirin superfamily)
VRLFPKQTGGIVSNPRTIKRLSVSRPTLEGAGVHLKRAFGFGDPHLFDPFLLLDDFRGDDPSDYSRGFPWHPHRGIETITYVLTGDVEHGDSLGNAGVIGAGDVQWMTAGSGIVHQEMPQGDALGRMYGFQLWANLPASQKMMDPRYREVKSADIPEVTLEGGVKVRVISGEAGGIRGPVRDIVIEPDYLDITLPAGVKHAFPMQASHTAFAYIFEGAGIIPASPGEELENGSLILFGEGDEIQIRAGDTGMRLLLISGKPLHEPIAWYGPIVMNTDAELELAFKEYREGTFIKKTGM